MDRRINTKDIMINEMYRQDKEDSMRLDLLGGKPLDQRIGVSDVYLVFDSIERDYNASDLAQGLLVFNIRNEGITGDGYIGASGDLHDIIGIESQSFIFPTLPCRTYNVNAENKKNKHGEESSFPILKPNVCVGVPFPCNDPAKLPTKNNYYTQKLNPDGTLELCSIASDPCVLCQDYLSQLDKPRISVQIKEMSEQSISDTGGKKHSLEFDLANAIYANPITFGYIFTDPISRLDTLSLVFRNHAGTPITFNPDMFPNTVLDCLDFVYTSMYPSITQPPYIHPYPSHNILPGTIGLPLQHGYALPAIPTYYAQFLELVTPTWNPFNTTGIITPNLQLNLRKLEPKTTDPKLYKYLTTALLLAGANGYNPDISFRLNPDIVMTEFISAYSKSFNLISGGTNYITVSRTSKQISLDYFKHIVIREWKEISQTWILPPHPLPVGNVAFHKFVEGKQFYIGNILVNSTSQIINWDGKHYHLHDLNDIYYDRAVLTESAPGSGINVPNPNAQGIFKNLRTMVVAVPTQSKRVTLKPNQFVVDPNIRTDFYDLIENKTFTFDGQYLNTVYTPPIIPDYIPTSLMPVKIQINNTSQCIRLFHQGVQEESLGTLTFEDMTPHLTNRVYHIASLKDIYADKIVLTAGFPGLSTVDVIISQNRMRIPLRFRKLVRRVTNMIAP